ncbi:uncharacterized protein FA14DRAFT_153338 [Meira miltonrushii]|uniref:SnoaL-like domain-containing protein n=1 Tax=Meira miltonrushii TaxID=1280837 RepID=A0A316VNJ8_9BASI|nr:uncharacterized protein FA14DRAFT_153338 [Meira miltonrushii]PWN37993.1 hypothetical protein FA14DRAFT_153338 [Meira miltonrushii]
MSNVERNKKAVQEIFQAKRPFNASKLAPYLSPEVKQIREDTEVIGKEQWLARLTWVFDQLLSDATFEPLGSVAEGNKVWTFAIIRNEPTSIVPDPSTHERETVDMFTFNDEGLLIEHRDVQQNALIKRHVTK